MTGTAPKYTVQGDKVRIRVPLLGRTQWLQSTSPTPAGLLWDPNIPATLQFTLPVTPTLAAAVQKVMTDIQAWIQAFHAEVDQRLKYWTRELELLLQAKVPPPAVNVPQIMTTLGFAVDAAP